MLRRHQLFPISGRSIERVNTGPVVTDQNGKNALSRAVPGHFVQLGPERNRKNLLDFSVRSIQYMQFGASADQIRCNSDPTSVFTQRRKIIATLFTEPLNFLLFQIVTQQNGIAFVCPTRTIDLLRPINLVPTGFQRRIEFPHSAQTLLFVVLVYPN